MPLETVVVTAAAVVLAALIAAVAAHLRQQNQASADLKRLKEQLAADGERLEQRFSAEHRRLDTQLAAERSRLEAQLADDRQRLELQFEQERLRQMAQLEHEQGMDLRHERQRRENEFRDVCREAGSALAAHLRALDDARTYLRSNHDLQVDHIVGFHKSEHILWDDEDRLAVWLGQDAAELETFREAEARLGAAATALYEVGPNDRLDSERATRFRENRQAAFDAQRRFLDLVSRRVGVSGPSGG